MTPTLRPDEWGHVTDVAGPHFATLHRMFEQQYTELAVTVDLVAERIRALGHRAPGSYTEFAHLSVSEAVGAPRAGVPRPAEGGLHSRAGSQAGIA